MLINLSNHPSSTWSEFQTLTAKRLYNEVKDIEFPTIQPQYSLSEVKMIVNEYVKIVLEFKPTAVHVMGEMIFVFHFVNSFKKANISCIASTTKRIVIEENGFKKSIFKFVQFREYF